MTESSCPMPRRENIPGNFCIGKSCPATSDSVIANFGTFQTFLRPSLLDAKLPQECFYPLNYKIFLCSRCLLLRLLCRLANSARCWLSLEHCCRAVRSLVTRAPGVKKLRLSEKFNESGAFSTDSLTSLFTALLRRQIRAASRQLYRRYVPCQWKDGWWQAQYSVRPVPPPKAVSGW